MWTRFSLRTRISLLLCALFFCAALLGLALLREFAAQQLRDENEAAASAVSAMTTALNAALQTSPDALRLLQSFVDALPSKEIGAIEYRSLSSGVVGTAPKSGEPSAKKRVPAWFVRFLNLPRMTMRHPVTIDGEEIGELTFEPSMEADLYEKWVGFLVIVIATIGLALMTIAITYLTVGKALTPLRELDRGLGRLREGDYSGSLSYDGPPEILGSLTAANDIASTLNAYDTENRALLRNIVSLQDDERRDLAREVHDELGPLLFSIRANATALLDCVPLSESPDHPSNRLLASVEALQLTNRRILERLRPNDLDALGFCKSIEALADLAQRQTGDLKIDLTIDPAIEAVEPVVSQTIYRVVQEGLTNILRHSEAKQASIEIASIDGWASVKISDDGVGLSSNFVAGRGLTGMKERTRALGGKFELIKSVLGGVAVSCILPAKGAALENEGGDHDAEQTA